MILSVRPKLNKKQLVICIKTVTFSSLIFHTIGSCNKNCISFFKYNVYIPDFPLCARRLCFGSRG